MSSSSLLLKCISRFDIKFVTWNLDLLYGVLTNIEKQSILIGKLNCSNLLGNEQLINNCYEIPILDSISRCNNFPWVNIFDNQLIRCSVGTNWRFNYKKKLSPWKWVFVYELINGIKLLENPLGIDVGIQRYENIICLLIQSCEMKNFRSGDPNFS